MRSLWSWVVAVLVVTAATAIAAPKPPKVVRTLKGHTDRIDDAAISADGEHVITLSSDKTARLWDGKGKSVRTFGDAKRPARAVAFFPDGGTLAVIVGPDLELWNVKTDTLARTIASVKSVSHSYDTIRMSMWISRDGAYVVTQSDSSLSVWNAATGKRLLLVSDAGNLQPDAEVFSPRGKQVVVAAAKETRLYDVTTGKMLHAFARKDTVDAVFPAPTLWTRFAHGGRVLRSYNGRGGDFFSWDASSGTALVVANITVTIGNKKADSLQTVRGAAFSPSGDHLLSYILAGGSQIATVYDLDKGAKAFELAGKPAVSHAVFNQTGTRIATVNFNGRLAIWDAANGKSIGQTAAHKGIIGAVKFSADGSRLVTAGYDKTAKVWDVEN